MNLPTVFDICVPREDVLKGTIAEADFAADLAKVLRGIASDDYQKPEQFFSHTYPTVGLQNLLRNVLARLSGDGSAAAAIFRLDTSYGGGKTHGLIALTHAANGMKGVTNIAEFVDPKFIPKQKIRIAAFDGENADPANGRNMGDGILAYTPWGELAYSLARKSGYERIRKSDETHTAPGAETLAELFGGEPSLILLDELSVYLRKAHHLHGAAAGDQLSAFLTSLFKAVESNPRVALVYTLAIGKEGKGSDAYSAENQFIADKMAEAESISARKATLLNPTEDHETVHVLLRRLFEKIDAAKAAPVIDAYRSLWLVHKELLPSEATRPETVEIFRNSYPLHPEVLETLTTKTATLANFQRVRGMLRLLARTVAQLWHARPADATAIHVHHIDLGFEPIRQEFFTKLGRTEFIPAVNHDIAGGTKQALAVELDDKYYAGLAPYATYTGRTVFLHSLAFNDQLKGIAAERLRFSVLSPALDLGFIDAVCKRFREESAYLDDRPGVPLRFLPETDLPARLKKYEAKVEIAPTLPEPELPAIPPVLALDVQRLVWAYIKQAAKMPNGGECVGEATANVTPWPHQVRTFQRLYDQWPPRLLIADEVGLGKTIEAGMLLRQAWLAGKARRVLILAPANICPQWQVELREKFNLHWPIYDGDQLLWPKSPGRSGPLEQPVARAEWHKQPFVIVSSHLMRRRERAPELIEQAEPWDIIVVDEAHHARRRAPGMPGERRSNRLLDLLQKIKERTHALLLMTATPMQVHPVEVWDLLSLLGLPPEWHEDAFLRFCRVVDHPSPSHEDLDFLAALFRVTEQRYGFVTEQQVRNAGASSGLQAKRVLSALRDDAAVPRRQLDANMRALAVRVIRSYSPIGRLVSRHTRDLLRRYHKAGKLKTPIADRVVEDRFVPLSTDEARIYEAVENYISTTYNQASPKEKNAVGFIMTIYRRRLASSFAALRNTLEDRLGAMETGSLLNVQEIEDEAEVELTDAENEVLGRDEVAELEREYLAQEEKSDIAGLLADIRRLPPDTKAECLRQELEKLRTSDYAQAMVFTQYTDTMDFLREQVTRRTTFRVMCFSGRGGEVQENDGRWRRISREEAKRRFRVGQADVLLCTDAAAEGLNFQFCGALINYDMPWNPMRVEQRIGRIDRLGQEHKKIRIINLHYEGTVEADVYMALRRRINLFESVVGRLQPILARLPSVITGHVLDPRNRDPDARSALTGNLEQQAEAAKQEGFDLDAMLDADLQEPPRPAPKLTLADLDLVIQRSDALPPGLVVKKLQNGEYAYQPPGMAQPVRVTSKADYYEEHSESVELWSAGSPCFPTMDDMPEQEISDINIAELLGTGK
jgi:superfamily II DNA or RNA helicase